MSSKRITTLLILGLCIKLSLFIYAEQKVPDLKIRNDTHGYLESGTSLVTQGVFGQVLADGTREYQFYRTPGYPLFLGSLHTFLKVPFSGIILLQILMTIVSAVIVSLAADKIRPGLGNLSFIIIVFDPAITVYSLMLLTESLFLFLMSVFLYLMISYLRENKMRHLLFAALTLAVAVYVRPICIYLGAVLSIFILWEMRKNGLKNCIAHAALFLITIFILIAPWQFRNYLHFHKFRFSNIGTGTTASNGIYKSYTRNHDPFSQGLPPIPYYANVSARCLASLLTRPVSLKYFNSEPLKKAGKILSYPWIVFWLIGFLRGISKIGKNSCFAFLGLVTFYFIATTVVGVMWIADARFRIPMMPFIAILSSYGWSWMRIKKPLSIGN